MLLLADVPVSVIEALLERYGLMLIVLPPGSAITGSFWGKPEAGIVAQTVYVRNDTPVHSLLHETCHVVCMSAARRCSLNRDAGGDDLEESAVCYLQVVLADVIEGVGQRRLMTDMDAWGYSFRLGSTLEWFLNDAEDAREFLLNHNLIERSGAPTYGLRE